MKRHYYIAGILLAISAWIAIQKAHNSSSEENVTQFPMTNKKMPLHRSSAATIGRADAAKKNAVSSSEHIAETQYNEQERARFMASIDALYTNTDELQKQQGMEVLRENLHSVSHLPDASEKLKEFFRLGPADIVNELLFDVSEITHPIQASLWRAAAERNDSHINSAILLHLEQQSGETFDNINSALSWASNKTF
jgi:hypothetical protein